MILFAQGEECIRCEDIWDNMFFLLWNKLHKQQNVNRKIDEMVAIRSVHEICRYYLALFAWKLFISANELSPNFKKSSFKTNRLQNVGS